MLKVFVFLRDPVDLSGGNSKQGRNLLQTFKSWSETQEPADSVSSETHFFFHLSYLQVRAHRIVLTLRVFK